MKYGQKRNNNSIGQVLDLFELRWTLPDHKDEIAQERLAAVKQLAGGVSHHFNNALQIILTAAELALQHPDVSNSVKNDILALIIQQSQEAAEVSRQLLDFSCQSVASKQVVDLVSIIQETTEQLASSWPKNIQISLSIDDSKPGAYMIQANPTQIRQVLTNLAANARDAMPAGGKLQFQVSTLESERPWFYPKQMSDDRWLVLSISDTGVGIPDDALPHIFEPFFTTKEVGQGSGLGLAQVYGIVKQHEGELEAESQVGIGTTFSLYFPALPSSWRRPNQILEKKIAQSNIHQKTDNGLTKPGD